MKTVKLGKFNVPDYAAEKPLMIRGTGELIYASDLLKKKEPPYFGLALASPENKAKLAIERLKVEPDFVYGILDNVGNYTKAEVIKHIQDQTSLGQQFADIEVNYAEYFANQLLGNLPKIPPKLSVSTVVKDAAILSDWKWVPKTHWQFFRTRVLFCENTTDSVTTPAANYRIANVHPVFAAKGFEVISLEGANDVRSSFIPKAKESRVVYISGLGHGSYTVYTGHMFSHILEVGIYDGTEVNGKVIHLLSCETAKTLGPDMVTHGAKASVGYTENFVFDWTNANLYWPCDSQFDISMANGKTVEQAVADTIAKFDAAIASVPGTGTAANLLNDRNLLRSPVSGAAWGSKTQRIYPYVFYYIPFAVYMSR
jgi:hypothetical protein